MICPKCGLSNTEGAAFCAKCGTSLNSENSTTISSNASEGNSSIPSSYDGSISQPVIEKPTEPSNPIAEPQGVNISEQPVVETTVSEKTSKKNKLIISLIIILLALLIVVFGTIFVIKFINKKTNDKYADVSSGKTLLVAKTSAGIPKYIDGQFTDMVVNDEASAFDALNTLKDDLKFNDVRKEFDLESTSKSENVIYYRFHQKVEDVLVYGINLIISVDKNGKVLGMNGYYIPNINVDVNNKKSKDELEGIVKDELGGTSEIIKSEKYIYADSNSAKVIYVIDCVGENGGYTYFIDANDGTIINKVELFETSAFDAQLNGMNGLLDVTIEKELLNYKLVDPNRKISIIDKTEHVFNEDNMLVTLGLILSSKNTQPMIGTINGNDFVYKKSVLEGGAYIEDPATAKLGVSTLKMFQEIYDYYKNNLGRTSYDNQGCNIKIALVSKGFQNAAWINDLNFFMMGYYGDISFATAKDVVGHEFSHAIMSSIVEFARAAKPEDKEKAFETGSINEGIADILGALIEGKNWLIGEDVGGIRNLVNPILDENPIEKGGQFFYPNSYSDIDEILAKHNWQSISEYDNGGVHHNATIVGHAAYLMYTNGAFKSREEMAKVWYNALYLMSSYSNFEDCAYAVIQSAKNLHLSEKSIGIIEKAFVETKMIEKASYELSGAVTSNGIKLDDVTIELKNEDNAYTFTTDKDGKYSGIVESGTYEMTFTKNEFEKYTRIVTIVGDFIFDVELGKNSGVADGTFQCESGNCHKVIIYSLDYNAQGGFNEKQKVYLVDDGACMNIDELTDTMNSFFGKDVVKTDGSTFTLSIAGFSTEFSLYYKDTDEKFDLTKPITEDIEIEMRAFGETNSTLKNFFNTIDGRKSSN